MKSKQAIFLCISVEYDRLALSYFSSRPRNCKEEANITASGLSSFCYRYHKLYILAILKRSDYISGCNGSQWMWSKFPISLCISMRSTGLTLLVFVDYNCKRTVKITATRTPPSFWTLFFFWHYRACLQCSKTGRSSQYKGPRPQSILLKILYTTGIYLFIYIYTAKLKYIWPNVGWWTRMCTKVSISLCISNEIRRLDITAFVFQGLKLQAVMIQPLSPFHYFQHSINYVYC